MLLGITGTDGSGKGSVVEYLVSRHGFVHYSARGLILDEIRRRGIEDTSRAQMRTIANDMRSLYGDDYIVTHNLKKIAEEGTQNAIIESLRAVAEAEALKKAGGILIAVDADQKIRYERVQGRRSETDKVSFEEFAAHEELEANDPDPHGMQKRKVMAMADHTIINNIGREELHREVEQLLRKLAV